MNKKKIKKDLQLLDKRSFNERSERIYFLAKLIKEERDIWMPQIPSFYLEEVKSCYINGDFAACILLCQATIEELLRTYYRVSGNNKMIRKRSEELINQAKEDKLISEKTAKELHELRQMRNPYTHVKAYEGSKKDIQWDWMPPKKNGEFDYNEKIKIETKAQRALTILFNYIFREMLKLVYPEPVIPYNVSSLCEGFVK